MVKRRRKPTARPSVARNAEDKGGTISEIPPVEAVPETVAPELPVTEDHAPSVHDALLETVSPEAIDVAGGHPAPASEAAPAEPEASAAPEDATADAARVEQAAPQDSAPQEATSQDTTSQDTNSQEASPDEAVHDRAEPALMQPPEAVEAAPDTDPAPEPVAATDVVTPPPAVVAPEAIPTQTRDAIRITSGVSIDVIGEIAEANATLLTFLRNEGNAAMAHWQSLSSAKTPADLLRIQVSEMQRVADASLTCFSALARRAGRLAAGIGRA